MPVKGVAGDVLGQKNVFALRWNDQTSRTELYSVLVKILQFHNLIGHYCHKWTYN